MVDTSSTRFQKPNNVYHQHGVRTIINASGAVTAVGGSLMPPEVIEAMNEASKAFVVIEELNAAVGKKIAYATGAEAGYVTAGAGAGMLLAVAACIAGTDPLKISRLPESDGMANEVIIHRTHRMVYDQMFRAAGGKFVEIGIARKTDPWELEVVISEKTACIAYIESPYVGPGVLEFETIIEIAHGRNVPVIVDAASTLPPVSHLRKWIDRGADLVIYSGGKGIRGPQNSGLLAGRADLVAAAIANGHPRKAIGRAAKVSKETIIGLSVALDRFLAHDHDHDHSVHLQQANFIFGNLKEREDICCQLNADPHAYPAPVVTVRPKPHVNWSARQLSEALKDEDPSIHCNVEHGALLINTHCLQGGDAEQIVDSVESILDRRFQTQSAAVQ